jgi:hypothetical protein
MFDTILNTVLFRNFRIQRTMRKWLECMESESAEEFLSLLLTLMSLAFLWNIKDFRRNIDGFKGTYLFKSNDKGIAIAVFFQNGAMRMEKGSVKTADIVVNFKNGKALMEYILSPKPDILGSMLRQDISLTGNLNYLYKFAFMAKRLQLMATGVL